MRFSSSVLASSIRRDRVAEKPVNYGEVAVADEAVDLAIHTTNANSDGKVIVDAFRLVCLGALAATRAPTA